MSYPPSNAARLYSSVKVQSVDTASPHRVIQMLLEGALSRVAEAQGRMQRAEVAEKSRLISSAISIIEGLRANLDMEQGGELATRLAALYEYMQARLLESNVKNDPEILEEVQGLIARIKSGWDAIEAHPPPVERRRAAG